MDRKQKIVVLGVIQSNGKILVCQRIDNKIKDAHLKWDIPGGTNELGESLEDTLKREVEEETGLNIEVTNLLPDCVSKVWEHEDYFLHTLVFCYICKLINGEIKMGDNKIGDLKWVSLNEALKLDLFPTTRVFLEMANNQKMSL